ncbi:hypothetical protein V6N13_038764 [Hibiscus sabdariffa]|uniref:Uncharacterized protein n=1 Tax=Hibiscus sabdariffa TaxID=183260 RepID=A0ABR2P3E3_9ROSI
MATPEFLLSARRPLQPKNTTAANVNFAVVLTKQVNSKPKQEHHPDDVSNKENLNHHHPKSQHHVRYTHHDGEEQEDGVGVGGGAQRHEEETGAAEIGQGEDGEDFEREGRQTKETAGDGGG